MTVARSYSFFLYVITCVLVLSVGAWAGEQNPTLAALRSDLQTVESAILSEDFAQAVVVSTSSLYTWKNSPDLPELTDALQRAYSGLSRTDAESLLTFRKQWLADHPAGLGWLDSGLLALAIEHPTDAVEAFRQAAADDNCCRVAFTHALLGTASLAVGQRAAARTSFDEALRLAAEDTATLFRIRAMAAEEWLNQGRLDESLGWIRLSQTSSYPLEQAWGFGKEIIYAWPGQDPDRLSTLVGELKEALSQTDPSPNLLWQQRVLSETQKILALATGALGGAQEARLTLGVQASEVLFKQGHSRHVITLLDRWVSEYPLEDLPKEDAGLSKVVLNAHLCHHAAVCLAGNPSAAAAGFTALLPYVSDDAEYRVKVPCWLGYCEMRKGEIAEAEASYEAGLALDAKDTVVPGTAADRSFAPNGVVEPDCRAAYAANYRYLERTLGQEEASQ